MGSVIEINEEDFDLAISEASMPVMVKFWASWCGPCRMMNPIVEELSIEYSGKMKFYSLNIDSCKEVTKKYNIMSIPTIMIFSSGVPVERIVGARTKADLEQSIKNCL